MIPITYLNTVRALLDRIERTQLTPAEQAADMVIESLTHGGAVHCSGIGHGMDGDFINRAGGLAALQHFSFGLNMNDAVAECLKSRPAPEPVERDLETVKLAVRTSSLRAGDIMVIGSVSGRNRVPVELALTCRAAGVKVLAFTSFDYSEKVSSAHPCGKKLKEVADIAIDIGAPYGDAAVAVPGIDAKVIPVSGVGFIVTGWMIWGRVMEKMAAAGQAPSVYISINREGGQAYYDKSKAEYNRRGF